MLHSGRIGAASKLAIEERASKAAIQTGVRQASDAFKLYVWSCLGDPVGVSRTFEKGRAGYRKTIKPGDQVEYKVGGRSSLFLTEVLCLTRSQSEGLFVGLPGVAGQLLGQ